MFSIKIISKNKNIIIYLWFFNERHFLQSFFDLCYIWFLRILSDNSKVIILLEKVNTFFFAGLYFKCATLLFTSTCSMWPSTFCIILKPCLQVKKEIHIKGFKRYIGCLCLLTSIFQFSPTFGSKGFHHWNGRQLKKY